MASGSLKASYRYGASSSTAARSSNRVVSRRTCWFPGVLAAFCVIVNGYCEMQTDTSLKADLHSLSDFYIPRLSWFAWCDNLGDLIGLHEAEL